MHLFYDRKRGCFISIRDGGVIPVPLPCAVATRFPGRRGGWWLGTYEIPCRHPSGEYNDYCQLRRYGRFNRRHKVEAALHALALQTKPAILPIQEVKP